MPRINGIMNLTDGERTGNDICSQQALAGVNVSANLFDNILSDVANEITNSIASDGSTVLQGNLKMGGNKVVNLATGTDATDGVNLSQIQALLESLVPAGTIIMTGQDTVSPPTGWLYCDGQTLSTTTYARLYSAIGTNFGTDGAGTFRVPDLRQRFPLGKAGGSGVTGEAVGETGGEIDHTHTGGSHDHQMQNHTHNMPSHAHDLGSNAYLPYGFSGNQPHVFIKSTSGYNATHFTSVTGGFTVGGPGTYAVSGGLELRGFTESSSGTSGTPSNNNTNAGGAVLTDENNPPYCTVNYIIKT